MTGILLDTHSFLWYVEDSERLSVRAREDITDVEKVYFSLASVWELSIKIGSGKLSLSKPLDEYLQHHIEALFINLLPISLSHAVRAGALVRHHGDPFDRMLIAQALVEQLPIISADHAFDAYGVQRVW